MNCKEYINTFFCFNVSQMQCTDVEVQLINCVYIYLKQLDVLSISSLLSLIGKLCSQIIFVLKKATCSCPQIIMSISACVVVDLCFISGRIYYSKCQYTVFVPRQSVPISNLLFHLIPVAQNNSGIVTFKTKSIIKLVSVVSRINIVNNLQ